ncbi:polysaccharide deacetylase family protein [Candidatus Azambacteria bacterium]|nr:polysaccharide deacetylase family protein [Candidatus Azambacteria bacterium]
MRSFVKTALYLFFYCLNHCAKLFFLRKEISVLMYHSVEDGAWKYGVGTEMFRRQLAYLRKKYHIVPLADIVAFMKGDIELPDKIVALTFDDGYADAHETVFPLIRGFSIPITVFLTTNLEKQWGGLERLTWEQVRTMHRSGLVRFEAHGHDHINLAEVSSDAGEMTKEIETCRDVIFQRLGYNVRYIAYAAGHKNDAVMAFVKKTGFEAAFSISEGLIKKGDDLFSVKRTQVDRTMSFFLFKARLTGAVDLNRKFVDFFRRAYGKK